MNPYLKKYFPSQEMRWANERQKRIEPRRQFCENFFGNEFAHELKSSVRGFVDVPVCDFKPSAPYPFGFEKEAEEVHFFGEEILQGAIVDALDCVMQHTRTILPTWVVIERIPQCFN